MIPLCADDKRFSSVGTAIAPDGRTARALQASRTSAAITPANARLADLGVTTGPYRPILTSSLDEAT
jgi:hypothetical protein